MALPFSFSSELKWSDHLNLTHGPFENGSNLYVVLLDKTGNTVEVWKSTDSGDSWAEQDSAGHPTVNPNVGNRTVSSIISGTVIYCFYFNDGSPGNVVDSFDTSTDTWGTVTAATTLSSAVNVSSTQPTCLARRSDGDFILLYNGATENVMGTQYRRVKYARHEGSTWTTSQDVAGTGVQINYDARAIILGSSDRAHLFYTDTTSSDLKHRSLSSANVLQTIQNIDTSVDIGNYSVGIPALNGSEIILPYKDSTGDLFVARATSADDPTWSTETVTPADPESSTANCGAAAIDGSVVYVFWPDAATDDIFRDNDAGSGTWGGDVEWKDAVTCQGINIAKITAAIGVLYNDNGTVKYDKYDIAAVAAAIRRRALLGVGA